MATQKQVKFVIDSQTGIITTEVLGVKGTSCAQTIAEIQAAIGGTVLETQKTDDYWKKPDPDPNFNFGK